MVRAISSDGELRQQWLRTARDPVALIDPRLDLGIEVAELQERLDGELPRADPEWHALAVAVIAPRWLAQGYLAARDATIGRVLEALDTASDERWLYAVLTGWSALAAAENALAGADLDLVDERCAIALDIAQTCDSNTRLLVTGLCARARRVLPSGAADHDLCAEGIRLARLVGLPLVGVQFQIFAAMFAMRAGDVERSARLGVAALQRARALGSAALTAASVGALASVPDTLLGDTQLPGPAELVALGRACGDPRTEMWMTATAIAQSLRHGDLPFAAMTAAAMLRSLLDGLPPHALGVPTMALVVIAAATGSPTTAARLHGAVAGYSGLLGATSSAPSFRAYQEAAAQARRDLGDTAFDEAAANGALLDFEGVRAEALRFADSVTHAAHRPPGELTRREQHVIAELALGRSNKEIAQELGITSKTVMHHTSSIYRKLGVASRSGAVAAWVAKRTQVGEAPTGTQTWPRPAKNSARDRTPTLR